MVGDPLRSNPPADSSESIDVDRAPESCHTKTASPFSSTYLDLNGGKSAGTQVEPSVPRPASTGRRRSCAGTGDGLMEDPAVEIQRRLRREQSASASPVLALGVRERSGCAAPGPESGWRWCRPDSGLLVVVGLVDPPEQSRFGGKPQSRQPVVATPASRCPFVPQLRRRGRPVPLTTGMGRKLCSFQATGRSPVLDYA